MIEGLEPGTTITAREIKTVDGFVLDGTPKTVKIKAGKAAELTFWNQKAGELVIRKLDKQTGKALAGVQFELTYAEGGYVDNANGHLSSNGLYSTDDHGEIHISGIVGTIVVKETKALPGYTIDPGTQTQTVTVKPQETQTLTFYNIPANTLTIHKYEDGTDNTPLAGVEFLVVDSTGAAVGPNNGYYTTDKDGRIVITGLTPGLTITVTETKTLEGYILDGKPQSIAIKEGEAQSLTFRNKKAGALVIRKLDSVTKKPLAGVEFQLTYVDGSYVDADNGHLSSKGLYTTDKNGEIRITGITGTIVITETKTISGYIIDEATRTQTVKVNAADTQTITVYNAPKTSMFLGYSELLNALDTGSTTKITINNKRLNRQDFEQKILLPRQNDYLDGYRAEYNAMLMDKVTDSSNSVVQERYITLSVHRKSVEEARTFFDRVTADVTTRLNHLDAHSEELDAVERLRVLHDFYRTGEETEYHMDLRTRSVTHEGGGKT